MTWLVEHAANAAWLIPSWLFLAGVVWTIRKARARGKRLYATEPYKRAGQIRLVTGIDHTKDAML
jgi:hypothetical protein